MQAQRRKMMKNSMKWLSILLFIAGVCSLSGCATMEGFGEEVETAGEEIQEASQ